MGLWVGLCLGVSKWFVYMRQWVGCVCDGVGRLCLGVSGWVVFVREWVGCVCEGVSEWVVFRV